MFNNPFQTRKDPLIEAVQKAQQDGEMRRQAEAIVNEQFGVYNRKAVIRENLAAYDAALESTYQGLKEGKAEKDFDKDGKIESPKDEVWGSRLRAAKMAGKMNEAPVDAGSMEGSKSVTKSAPKEDPSTPKSYPGAASSAPTAQRLSNAKASIKEAKGTAAAQNLKHKDFKETRHSNPGALTKAAPGQKNISEEDIEEAAYSAKAARAGKDIGKPGKQFAKIAKSAGAKYGSEERGKKVAGAILAKIRAKHMKEEQIDEIVQKSQMRPGETLGQTMNRLAGKTAIKGGANDPSSPNFKGPKPAEAPKGVAGAATQWADPGKRDYSKDNTGVSTTKAPAGPEAPASKPAAPTAMQNPDQERTKIAPPKKDAGTSSGSSMQNVAESLNEGFVQVGTTKYKIV